MNTHPLRVLSATVPGEMIEALDRAAVQTDSSRSRLVREALRAYLVERGESATAGQKEQPPAAA